MREILFRGKQVANGEWVYGFYNGQAILTYYDNKYKMLTNIAPDTHAIIYKHKVIPETVGQYTGLTDKNGKRIFEGDIVKFRGENYVIRYIQEYTRFSPSGKRGRFSIFTIENSEVIGNIHDNPELLEGKEAE